MKKLNLITLLFFLFSSVFGGYLISFAGDKQMTIAWEQEEADLPSVDYWKLFSSTDGSLAFDQWKDEGNIPYVPDMPLTAPIIITAPDGQETSFWFKMTAVSSDGMSSSPSEVQENAPTVIDFKAPMPAVLSASYNNQTKTVTLTWMISPDDTDVAIQKLYRSSTAGGPYVVIGTDAEMQSPYDYVVQPSDSGKWLYFVVVLTDSNGNFSDNSNEVAVKLSMGVPFNIRVTVSSQ